MKTSQMITTVCLAGGFIAVLSLSAQAQHSSGGTPPSVTEGQQGQAGGKTQGVPGSGWNPNDRPSGSQQGGSGGSGSGMGSSSSMGSGSGGDSGSSMKSGEQMGSGEGSGSQRMGSSSGGSTSGGSAGGGR